MLAIGASGWRVQLRSTTDDQRCAEKYPVNQQVFDRKHFIPTSFRELLGYALTRQRGLRGVKNNRDIGMHSIYPVSILKEYNTNESL